MPELPEVETTRRGLEPWVSGKKITRITIRQASLRWSVPEKKIQLLRGQVIHRVSRRAKYLLFHADPGVLLIHLGMSGSLRILETHQPPQPHDHVDIHFGNLCLRYRDPRRFGAILWATDPQHHPLLEPLGPEPLSEQFDGAFLFRRSRKRKVAVKNFIMNSRIVVGVGNIYASEALFMAGIDPRRPAGRISLKRYMKLAGAIRQVLTSAIEAGGTTLRDFVGSSGNPGYFSQELNVYGREGQPCPRCGGAIQKTIIGQRSTFFCRMCQR
ncbi:MAG: bifunctional DNA-formamidopyrimidine glycosylase/DNA-(apurinic or apyrimidinic site) lyase [Gammaproteobacteria bacterium]|nr:MAG: bifunctional DNA-formamidopyrimidine glycosylase/DNA-(apurinic or apyrimidinic site) lyase [Gammaproteobacteria bacterium]